MWKIRPEDNRAGSYPSPTAQPASAPVVAATTPALATPPKESPKPADFHRPDVARIGKSVSIRGELTGNEDLYLDGEMEGTISLRDHKLVIGPNGKIKANITARDVVVHGRVEGNISTSERVELKRASNLIGDLTTQRIVIEDGAFFKGAIDIKDSKGDRTEVRRPMISASMVGGSNATASGPTLSANAVGQGSFLEPK
jgi:cytoskeletal protein CcmA (bactofilin family)